MDRLQWGHGTEAVEIPAKLPRIARNRRFNGATAQRPWKFFVRHQDGTSSTLLQWGHGTEAVEIAEAAILSPTYPTLQWGHGTEAVEIQNQTRIPWCQKSFNGATAQRPWKSLRCNPRRQTLLRLQWGHGTEAVEIALNPTADRHAGWSSCFERHQPNQRLLSDSPRTSYATPLEAASYRRRAAPGLRSSLDLSL